MKAELEDSIRLLLRNGNIKEAEAQLMEAYRDNKQDDAVYYWWGNLRRQQSNWKEALQLYAQAIELNPGSPAREARELLLQIIQFRDTQRYNV
ncbi:MAG: tetratricopeptide repeat protein [Bacteroidaceae bacterium]|nr:tetratricopeptide repeat protein [Bacteroidaceae bacterium]